MSKHRCNCCEYISQCHILCGTVLQSREEYAEVQFVQLNSTSTRIRSSFGNKHTFRWYTTISAKRIICVLRITPL
jgi:hypothetical protein